MTKVFPNYLAFLMRSDLNINGVSPEFLKTNPLPCKNCVGTWNCSDCVNCIDCISCESCTMCFNCWGIVDNHLQDSMAADPKVNASPYSHQFPNS